MNLLSLFSGNQNEERMNAYEQGKDFAELWRNVTKERELHPYLKKVNDEHSFKLKINHCDVLREIFFLEDLHKAIRRAPMESIVFHMDGKNDFANWIEDVIGDSHLGAKIREIKLENPYVTKARVARVMKDRISKLKLIR